MIYFLIFSVPIVVLVPFLFDNFIKAFVIRYCNGFFFNKFFIENEQEIPAIIESCQTLFEQSVSSSLGEPLQLTLEHGHFFDYFKIQDSGEFNIFVGPIYNKNHEKTEKIKPFLCYTKKTENMSIKDVKQRLFYLKLFKDSREG